MAIYHYYMTKTQGNKTTDLDGIICFDSKIIAADGYSTLKKTILISCDADISDEMKDYQGWVLKSLTPL